MARRKTIEEAAYRYVKKSLIAFIEGGKYARDGKPKNMNWVMGVIKAGVGPEILRQILDELNVYSKDKDQIARFNSAIEECQKQNLL